MQLALKEAQKCVPTPTAFCVGCVIVAPSPTLKEDIIISTGFSRELPGNTHAEANALTKARLLRGDVLAEILHAESPASVEDVLATADVYTTLEPCSVRTSGLAPCADALIATRIRRCFIGVGEPDDFVNCEGARKLHDAGIEVIWLADLEKECLEEARRGH
jgi:pyrimidine deaminase RibD-like protein